MPLTGIEIFKSLPKTNCGECGVPTCLAFAMSLAAGKVELAACPRISLEVRVRLEEAAAPPVRPVTIGTGDNKLKVGGETVLFRHEKRFENQPGIAVLVSDTELEASINGKIARFRDLRYTRVGQLLRPELIAVKNNSGDKQKFIALIERIKNTTDANLILMCDNPEIFAQALKTVADRKPLLYAATKENSESMVGLAKQYGCPLAVKGQNLGELAELTDKIMKAGVNDLVLNPGSRDLKQAFQDEIQIRTTAINKKFRPIGFPTIVFPSKMTDDPAKEAVIASIFVAKYGGIIVLSDLQGESLFPLLVERLNIYTDPQRPLATAEGIYEIGNPDRDSPVLLTCNFSLTYFIVSGEIESSRVPSYLLVRDTEGLSVMTAWAAGKFTADTIAPFVKKSGIADKVNLHKLVIPGYIASEESGLKEELPDWEILVGPREAAHLPAYLKARKERDDR